MITLKVQVDGKSQEHSFPNGICRLGPPDAEATDLAIPSSIPELWGLSISIESTGCRLISSVESPLITVNGAPFEEITLEQPQAKLVVGGVTIELAWDASEVPLFKDSDGQEIPAGDLDIDAELSKLNEIFDLGVSEDDSLAIDPDLLSEEQLDRLVKEASEMQIPEEAPAKKITELQEAAERLLAKERPPVTVELSEERADPELESLLSDSRSNTKLTADEKAPVQRRFDPSVSEEASFESGRAAETVDWRDLEVSEQEAETTTPASAHVAAHSEESLSDDIQSDKFDESYRRPESRLRPILMVVMAVLIVCGGITMAMVYSAKGKNVGYERMAAVAISDLGMALLETGGMVNVSVTQDLLQPDFLREHLTNVIAEPYYGSSPFLSGTDDFRSVYDVHVFRSLDLKRFVLLATPKERWLAALAPAAQYLVTSTSMELRRVTEVDSWFAVLEGKASLDEVDPSQLAMMEKRSQPVHLASLDDRHLSNGFSLPKALSDRGSQGASKLYNAPRYYPFGHRLLSALQDTQTYKNRQSRQLLDQIVDEYSQLPGLVVYTAQGPEVADLLQRVMAREWKDSAVQIGYVVLEGKTAKVVECDLAASLLTYAGEEHEVDAASELSKITTSARKSANGGLKEEIKTDPKHPLFVNLMDLANRRRSDLEKYSKRLEKLMSEHNTRQSAELSGEYQSLMAGYLEASEKHRQKISQVLTSLAKEARASDPVKGLDTFVAYVQTAQLTEFLPEELKPKDDPLPESASVEAEEEPVTSVNIHHAPLANLLTSLSRVETLADLNILVGRVATKLQHDSVNFTEGEQANYYGELRARALQKINQLLLSPISQNPATVFNSENRLVVTQILNNARVTEAEERTYYLDEFDRLVAKYHGQAQQRIVDLENAEKQAAQAIDGTDGDKRSKLNEERRAISDELKTEKENVKTLEAQITSVPLDLASTEQGIQRNNSARLGQQILVQAAKTAPSGQRDGRLMEAISLMAMGTEENRGLWQEILEARRLLAEAPEVVLVTSIDSDLGLTPAQESRTRRLRTQMNEYVSSLADLVALENPQQYDAQYKLFKQEQGTTLTSIVALAESLKKDAEAAEASIDEYLNRLETFATDYETAKKEGFFVNNKAYHQGNVTQLRRKIGRLSPLAKEFHQRCQELQQFSTLFGSLAQEEARRLESGQPMEAKHLSNLRRQIATSADLDPASPPLVDKLRKVIAMEVLPIPQ